MIQIYDFFVVLFRDSSQIFDDGQKNQQTIVIVIKIKLSNSTHSIMSDKRKKTTNMWLAIGAVFLIILLIIWLTVADLAGDTDVAAIIPPLNLIR